MEENRRSGDRPDIVVKRRSSSGCLIVRKKSSDAAGVGVGSSGSCKGFDPKRERKRSKFVMSDSGSSDELLLPPPRRGVAAETIRVCSGLSGGSERGVVESRGFVGRNGGECRKRNRLDVFEFDEYDGIDGETLRRRHFDDGRKLYLGSPPMSRGGGVGRQFESGSGKHGVIERRNDRYFDGASMPEREACIGKKRYEVEHDMEHRPVSLKEKYPGRSDEAIRVQGKNGVLKVLLNKKKVSEALRNHDHWESEETSRKSMKTENIVKPNSAARPSLYSETKRSETPSSSVLREKKKLDSRTPLLNKVSKSSDNNMESDDSDTSSKQGPPFAESKGIVRKVSHVDEHLRKSKIQVTEKIDKTPAKKIKKTPIKKVEKSPTKTPSPERPSCAKTKEGSIRRGSGTEKQKLRDRIKQMLLDASWKIDYRPRRNRDYQDAVYINPNGTAYWSIIKAYDALQKQFDDSGGGKCEDKRSAFTISDETLSQLTRKTQKKIEKELKKNRTDGDRNQSINSSRKRNAKTKHEEESMDSDSEEQKLSSFIRQGSKSSRSRTSGNDHSDRQINKQLDSTEQATFSSSIPLLQGRKNRKLGRCTLLVRGSDKSAGAEGEEFVPYTGKRTLLSWLIDSGVVKLSQKVQYMNRRKTQVMLEGWITGDGIHCGCCSKILSVSKFEIHAGSKLRQPFQNIHLDSGVSLLQCQIDAWNKQEEPLRKGFFTVDIDGDDPNDDTCSLCGDGGDLICCDGCPSTFHLNCLNIQMLPPGDWHCPNCTCKYCGVASSGVPQGDTTSVDELYTCKLCEKKFHKSCIKEEDVLSMDSGNALLSFCDQKCRELFGSLRKYLGVKHELEGGFSWSFIHRTDPELDTSLRGLPQRVECNSKLAVALTIMDECFLPIVDRRSKINMMHSVLYNCGSNFNRLNFSGFYTMILERGDEIICAASLRFHGSQLAEMPFIGTRHIYRRQGMCRRLFSAIESTLCSLKVENLVIPAVSELIDTWMGVFGFTSLEDSLKQEMRSLNMLVFPGLDMLQKQLPREETARSCRTAGTGVNSTELKQKEVDSPLALDKSDDASAADGLDQSNDSEDSRASDMSAKADTMDDDKLSRELPVNGSSNVPYAPNSDPNAGRSSECESIAPNSAVDKRSDRDEVAQASSSMLGGMSSQIVEINGVNDVSVSSIAKDSQTQFKCALSSDSHCSPTIEDKPVAGSSVNPTIEDSNILDAIEAKVDVGCMETSPALVEKKLTSSSIEGPFQDPTDIANESEDEVDAGHMEACLYPVENRTQVSSAEGTFHSSCDRVKANEVKVEIAHVEAYTTSGEDRTHVHGTFHNSGDIIDVKEAKVHIEHIKASPLSSVDRTHEATSEGVPHSSGGADGDADVVKVNMSCMGVSPSLDDKIQDSTMECTWASCNRDIDNVNDTEADTKDEPCSASMEDEAQHSSIACPSQVSVGTVSADESKGDDACKAPSSVAINTQDIDNMSTDIPPSFHSSEACLQMKSTFICENSYEVDCTLAESAGQMECLSSDMLIDCMPVSNTPNEGKGREIKNSDMDEQLT